LNAVKSAPKNTFAIIRSAQEAPASLGTKQVRERFSFFFPLSCSSFLCFLPPGNECSCGGKLRDTIINFGESLDGPQIGLAFAHANKVLSSDLPTFLLIILILLFVYFVVCSDS
jgi:hypothetical protein